MSRNGRPGPRSMPTPRSQAPAGVGCNHRTTPHSEWRVAVGPVCARASSAAPRDSQRSLSCAAARATGRIDGPGPALRRARCRHWPSCPQRRAAPWARRFRACIGSRRRPGSTSKTIRKACPGRSTVPRSRLARSQPGSLSDAFAAALARVYDVAATRTKSTNPADRDPGSGREFEELRRIVTVNTIPPGWRGRGSHVGEDAASRFVSTPHRGGCRQRRSSARGEPSSAPDRLRAAKYVGVRMHPAPGHRLLRVVAHVGGILGEHPAPIGRAVHVLRHDRRAVVCRLVDARCGCRRRRRPRRAHRAGGTRPDRPRGRGCPLHEHDVERIVTDELVLDVGDHEPAVPRRRAAVRQLCRCTLSSAPRCQLPPATSVRPRLQRPESALTRPSDSLRGRRRLSGSSTGRARVSRAQEPCGGGCA